MAAVALSGLPRNSPAERRWKEIAHLRQALNERGVAALMRRS